MAFWSIDLTTRDGAEGAARLGGVACFAAMGFTLLGLLLSLASYRAGVAPPLPGAAYVVEALVFGVAGWRLRAGIGVIWGSAAAVLMALEILAKVFSGLIVPGLVVNLVLLIVIANGVRGARAVKRGSFSHEEDAEIFG